MNQREHSQRIQRALDTNCFRLDAMEVRYKLCEKRAINPKTPWNSCIT